MPLARTHHAGVDVRQQAGLAQHRGGCLRDVAQRAGVAQGSQLSDRLGVQQLRLVACEQARPPPCSTKAG